MSQLTDQYHLPSPEPSQRTIASQATLAAAFGRAGPDRQPYVRSKHGSKPAFQADLHLCRALYSYIGEIISSLEGLV